MTEVALVENLQREGLDPIEEALAYQGLMAVSYTHLKSVTAIIGLMPANEDINTKRGCTSCSQKDCTSRKLPEKATVTSNNEGEEGCNKTTAEASGITMKGQPTE